MGQDAIPAVAVAVAGVTVEVRCRAARDLGDSASEAVALHQADELIGRLRPLATAARPVERARLISARAEQSRAAGQSDGALYAEAARRGMLSSDPSPPRSCPGGGRRPPRGPGPPARPWARPGRARRRRPPP